MTFREWIDWILGRKPPPPPPPAVSDLLTMHNDERRRRGIMALSPDARLLAAAANHVVQMAISGTLSHDGLADRVAASGYPPAVRVGENVACGRGMDASACWALWVASPQHLRNAIDPSFRDVGFGSAVSARDGQTYWCAVYGATQ